MNVLHIYKTYFPDPPGGLQEAIHQICLATKSEALKNTIFTLSSHNRPRVINAKEGQIIREKSWLAPASCDIGGIHSFLTFKTLVHAADIIVYHFPWPFADLLTLCTKSKKPSILVYHSDIVRQKIINKFYSPLMWKTLLNVSCIVATSPNYIQTSPILTHTSIQHKVRMIPLGLDRESYQVTQSTSIHEKLGLLPDEHYFLFVGVLRYYKGLQYLIEAAKSVNAKVVIAGSGPEQERLWRLKQKLNVNNVIFAGQISKNEKIDLLRYCYSFILPSHLRSEAFGVVLIEAGMFKKPMISCEIGTGTSYANLHGLSGLVVAPQSSQALSQAMNDLLSNPKKASQMGLSAYARYQENFSSQALSKNYLSLFKEVLSNLAPSSP